MLVFSDGGIGSPGFSRRNFCYTNAQYSFPCLQHINTKALLSLCFACQILCVGRLEVGRESMGQRPPVPVGVERDSCLLSQPPLQLEYGSVWSRHGPSNASVFSSGHDAMQKGREALSLAVAGSGS